MCCNTKQKIADVLRQQMMERPFEKITVQNLMDAANMKRQSFYYHFQDTRDVLMWICVQQLQKPLEREDLCLREWLLYMMELLNQQRGFYRRVLKAAHPEFVREFGLQVFRPKLAMQFFQTDRWETLDAQCQFVVDFASMSASIWMIQFVQKQQPLDREDARKKLGCLLDTLNIPDGVVKIIRVG